ncbi:alpha-L-rhamnosidase [Pumilibacter intestinalis]|uniref:alpha-L-rhamnosidase n=1 Tax=Pumilibacter intestinalis TaxID=2941511 RepID=UPI00203F7694|nr:alpha-L-rhamnosidase [Pumilibacter intestinalis]
MSLQNIKWIGFRTDPTYDESNPDQPYGAPAMYVYKKFKVKKSIARATLECSALGVYAAYVNGNPTESFLEPGFTDYSKRIYSRKYDVTALIVGGCNSFGACVGDGWYTGNVAMVRRQRFGKYPLGFCARLEIKYRDGEVETIDTDAGWSGTLGAVRENDILNGETHDFRLPHSEVFTADYSDGCAVEERTADIVPQESDFEGVRLCESFKPIYLRRNEMYALVDFGQNMAGVLHTVVRGERGTRVTLRHAETIDKEGALYTENFRSARNTDTLILSGGEDDFTPLFCYHGFRYAELSADAPVEILFLEARAVHNELADTGKFDCSSQLIDTIYRNAKWSMKSNFVSVPTDCPQRDERLGWLADVHLFAGTAMYFADCDKFYRRFMRDISDATTDDGVADYAPYVGIFGHNNGGWADCAVILPYLHYRRYGDKRIIRENVEVMRKHIRASIRTAAGGVRKESAYGDWLNIGADTPKEVFCTAYHYYGLGLYLYLLDQIGETDFQATQEREKTYHAFRANFVSKDGAVYGDTQTGYVLAYTFGLIGEAEAAKHLRRKFTESDMKLTTGFNGGKYLLPTLCDTGLGDIAYSLILGESYPGWGYSIRNGATTMWERWNSYTLEDGFGDASMNSFNHYVFGSCVEWMYRYMLGIREDAPGFSRILIAPRFDPAARVTSANGEFESRRGKIRVQWTYSGGEYVFEARCPREVPVRFDFGDNAVRKSWQSGDEYRFRIDAPSFGAGAIGQTNKVVKRIVV